MLLEESLVKYERLKKGEPQAKAVQEVAKDFQRIFTTYAARSNGNIARLIYANMCYEVGDYTQAAELYKASLSHFDEWPMIRFQILKSLGYASEGLKDYAGAAGYFEAALNAGEKPLLDDVLFELGDIYATLGQRRKARRRSSASFPTTRTRSTSNWRGSESVSVDEAQARGQRRGPTSRLYLRIF